MATDRAISAAAAALGRKGGLKRNPLKGFGSDSRRAADAARRRWELYRLRQVKNKVR